MKQRLKNWLKRFYIIQYLMGVNRLIMAVINSIKYAFVDTVLYWFVPDLYSSFHYPTGNTLDKRYAAHSS